MNTYFPVAPGVAKSEPINPVSTEIIVAEALKRGYPVVDAPMPDSDDGPFTPEEVAGMTPITFVIDRASQLSSCPPQPCPEATRDPSGDWRITFTDLPSLLEFVAREESIVLRATDRGDLFGITIYDDYLE